MTGLKQIENQRAFEKAQEEAKQEPAYQLLEEIFKGGYIHSVPGAANLHERVRVYLTTGTLLQKS
jgi:hypothetical protein